MSTHLLYVLNVTLHLLAAIVWVGGMLFLVGVIVPAVSKPPLQEVRGPLFQAVGVAFRRIGWVCIIILVVTGILNLHFRGMLAGMKDPAFWHSSFGQVLALKLAAVGLLILLSGLHDFWIGPRASRAALREAGSPAAASWRRWASWMARVSTLLALVVIVLGVMLVRGRPW